MSCTSCRVIGRIGLSWFSEVKKAGAFLLYATVAGGGVVTARVIIARARALFPSPIAPAVGRLVFTSNEIPVRDGVL